MAERRPALTASARAGVRNLRSGRKKACGAVEQKKAPKQPQAIKRGYLTYPPPSEKRTSGLPIGSIFRSMVFFDPNPRSPRVRNPDQLRQGEHYPLIGSRLTARKKVLAFVAAIRERRNDRLARTKEQCEARKLSMT
jgi:hypothetical protein